MPRHFQYQCTFSWIFWIHGQFAEGRLQKAQIHSTASTALGFLPVYGEVTELCGEGTSWLGNKNLQEFQPEPQLSPNTGHTTILPPPPLLQTDGARAELDTDRI